MSLTCKIWKEIAGHNMINTLPQTISLYSSSSRSTVSSLIRDMKVEKSDLQFLVNRISSMAIDQNYSSTRVPMFSLITKEVLMDSFRNLFLRIQNLFDAANATGIALNSMVDVFSSEVQKVENDINKLELFIDNYEFISGKDDLFNANYIEKFDSFVNDYKSDNITFTIPDRDSQIFSDTGNGFIDSVSGVFKIGSRQNARNIIKNIKSIKIKNNYNNYITTNGNFENLFNDNFSDSWSVTVKSPVILTTQLSDYVGYLNYDYSKLTGAVTVVELELLRPIYIDTIRMQPNQSTNFRLLQVVAFHEVPAQANNVSPSENYTILLNSPALLNRSFDLRFDKKNISKFIFIFNQQDYTKNNRSPISSELNSKILDSFVKAIINDRKIRFSKYQDIMYWFFRRNNTIRGIAKNKKTDINYYTYRFPSDFDSYIYNLDEQIKEFNSLATEDRNIFTNTPVFANMINAMLNSFSGKYKIFDSNVYTEALSGSSSSSILSNPSFTFMNSTNLRSDFSEQFNTPAVGLPSEDISSKLEILESESDYEYSFSLSSIEFLETQNISADKAVFVSKKLPINGQVTSAKSKVYFSENMASVIQIGRDILTPASYELSISNKAIPSQESDWIPISSYGSTSIDSEVIFVNANSKKAELRFYATADSVILYKDGNIVPRLSTNYTYSPSNKTITILDPIFNPNSRFVVSYNLDFSNSSPDEVDFIRTNIFLQSVRFYSSDSGSGESFVSTDSNLSVSLSYVPYVNLQNFSNLIYNKLNGTIFIGNISGYSPVKVVLGDGTAAINLTNYSSSAEKVSFYSTNDVLFIQSGKNLVFNRPINQPFTVYYEYIPNDLRFRLIVRKNIVDATDPISIDSVIMKMKVLNSDPYYEKLNAAML